MEPIFHYLPFLLHQEGTQNKISFTFVKEVESTLTLIYLNVIRGFPNISIYSAATSKLKMSQLPAYDMQQYGWYTKWTNKFYLKPDEL